MAGKPSRGVVAGVAIAVVGGLAALGLVIALVVGGAKESAPTGPADKPAATPNGNQVGPDMGQADPTPSATATAQAALQTPTVNDPHVDTASAGKAGDPPPGDIVFKEAALEFTAVFPQAGAHDPVMMDLRGDAQEYLQRIRFNAREAHATGSRKGEAQPPWIVKIKWDYTAEAGDIVSLSGVASEDTGGAHPLNMVDTHIARAATGAPIKFMDMFTIDRQPSPALVMAVCEALKTEKMKRIKSATIYDEPIECTGLGENIKLKSAKFALAPSSVAGKFGGVYVYYAPYDVGAYAEGAYKLTVQQGVFAEDLRPDYKPLFGGEAPPVT